MMQSGRTFSWDFETYSLGPEGVKQTDTSSIPLRNLPVKARCQGGGRSKVQKSKDCCSKESLGRGRPFWSRSASKPQAQAINGKINGSKLLKRAQLKAASQGSSTGGGLVDLRDRARSPLAVEEMSSVKK